ncbi:MAG: hypothetical protein K9K66_11115 [Desulfarculaceae bacterium]|nr:hypothetical protein [Desulfarculaceae bacterium]MCF8070760.1 hypothetical protein [Desulfarculaceae bacterium]MCF8102197.1 hypothetical protein [Desulfarculaceae bacterium]MCF8117004.1 hypothetical protein [Desulfarculaceae bacterium]
MKTWIVNLTLAALVLAAGAAWGGQAVTTLEEVYLAINQDKEINLCGYYNEGGKVLQIKQSGSSIKGYISQGGTGCISAPELYFHGTLSGLKFTGKMIVCNPDICVEAGKMPPTRETDFNFVAFEDGKRLVGTWIYDSIEYKEEGGQVVSCWDAGQEERPDFLATRTGDDCASLQRALENQKKMLSYYTGYLVTRTGAVVGPDGREVAGDFNHFQSWLENQASQPQAGNSGVDGSISFWEFNDVMSGNTRGHASLCWCDSSCTKNTAVDCQETWAEDECRTHEAAHCQTIMDFCEQNLVGKSYDQAWAAWQAYLGDTAAHMADEINAYQTSIAYLEEQLKQGGCN